MYCSFICICPFYIHINSVLITTTLYTGHSTGGRMGRGVADQRGVGEDQFLEVRPSYI